MKKDSFTELWEVFNIRYSLYTTDKVINFIVTDVSQAKEDPMKIKPLVNVVLPLDQNKFAYIDDIRDLSFECSRE